MQFTNLFNDEFDEFRESSFFQKLEKKFKPLPYYKKYKAVKKITLVSSYLFNLLSGITASSLVYLFLLSLSNWWVSLCCTTVIILLFELLKRKLTGLTCKDYLARNQVNYLSLLAILTLTTLSITSSYYGSKKMVLELTPVPTVMPTAGFTANLETQISEIDKQIESAMNTKWKGTTTTTSQRTIEHLSKQKEALLMEIVRARERMDSKNDETLSKHESQLKLNAKHFALVTLVFELLFLLSSFYLEYYDYRSYVEFHKPLSAQQVMPPPVSLNVDDSTIDPVATMITDPTILQAAIKNAKSNLAAYQSKMKNNQGTVGSNQRGIERWERKLLELRKLMPNNGIEAN